MKMDYLQKLITSKKIIPVTDITLVPRYSTGYLIFIHRQSKRFHITRSSRRQAYLTSFFVKCKEVTQQRDSPVFSVFIGSTAKEEWSIFTVNISSNMEDIQKDLTSHTKLSPFVNVNRCTTETIPKGLYTVYKVTSKDSSLVRWLISMKPYTDSVVIERVKFGLSGVSGQVDRGEIFPIERRKFLNSDSFKVVRYPDAKILSTVRPSMFANLSTKLNNGVVVFTG